MESCSCSDEEDECVIDRRKKMESCCFSDEEDECFFDTREDLSPFSDSSAGSGPGSGYEIWDQDLDSVRERRSKFFKLVGLDSVEGELDDITVDVDGMMACSAAVLRDSCFVDGESCNCSFDDDVHTKADSHFKIKNLDDGTEFVVDEWGEDGNMRRLRHVSSNRLYTMEEFQRSVGVPPLVEQFMQREARVGNDSEKSVGVKMNKKKAGWLKKLGAAAHVVDRLKDGVGYVSCDSDCRIKPEFPRVNVRSIKKRQKDLSSLYMGQEIDAHAGPILTMKFSLDGEFLASAGEDGVVRVWEVIESKLSEHQIPVDPNGVHFKLSKSSALTPLFVDQDKACKGRRAKGNVPSTCSILPPTIFHLSDKPVHEFRGHCGDVLNLSWSRNQYLLSSSVDKTVRLWKVGCDHCLSVFSHNDYVTSVQFNPVDDNYFISGSIDGKVRIWDIKGVQVVGWTDVKDIVTAVCYQPDGQGAVVGSMSGNCRFYSLSGNRLILDGDISLQGKKKSLSSRITGIEYSPTDWDKIMVTSADSKIRILDGHDVVSKYKGLRNAGSHISASFSSDGRHIISASEDSNVYIWNYKSRDESVASKKIWSSERFFASHVSLAIPWCSKKSEMPVFIPSETLESCRRILKGIAADAETISHCYLESVFRQPNDHFPRNQGFCSEGMSKCSATWPEEMLPTAKRVIASSSVKYRTQYKFLKISCQSITSHAWGMVIVTAGWDGKIRSFLNYGLPLRL